MALPGFKSKGDFDLTGRVQPTLQDETTSDKVTSSAQQVCQSSQEQLFERGSKIPDGKKGSGKSRGSVLTSLLRPVVPKPQNRWRSILYLSILNMFLKMDAFKVQTPETVRLSLQ